jgi:hypothetical protein
VRRGLTVISGESVEGEQTQALTEKEADHDERMRELDELKQTMGRYMAPVFIPWRIIHISSAAGALQNQSQVVSQESQQLDQSPFRSQTCLESVGAELKQEKARVVLLEAITLSWWREYFSYRLDAYNIVMISDRAQSYFRREFLQDGGPRAGAHSLPCLFSAPPR